MFTVDNAFNPRNTSFIHNFICDEMNNSIFLCHFTVHTSLYLLYKTNYLKFNCKNDSFFPRYFVFAFILISIFNSTTFSNGSFLIGFHCKLLLNVIKIDELCYWTALLLYNSMLFSFAFNKQHTLLIIRWILIDKQQQQQTNTMAADLLLYSSYFARFLSIPLELLLNY